MKNFLIGYQHLDYINAEGKHIKGTRVDLMSTDYTIGKGYGVNSYFTNDTNLINTLNSLEFREGVIFLCDVDCSIYNCRVNLKAIRNAEEIIIN